MKQALYAMALVLIAALASAMPPLPHEIYGTLEIDGKDAPKGTNISIYDKDGVMCGSQLTRHVGLYGLVSCRGDDPETMTDEGALNGEEVTIRVEGKDYRKLEWQSARFTNENITMKEAHASIKIPRMDREKPMLAFFAAALLVLLLSIIFIRKAIEE